MAAQKLDLDDTQKFALMKFRRNVSDVLKSHHDDYFLVRWLRARSWDATAAEKMLRQSLLWRQEWEVDTALKNWEPPEALAIYHPCGTSGYDKDGAPVIIVPFGNLDIIGLLHSVSRQDLIRLTVKLLEKNLDLAAKTGANQVSVIFDMEGFSLRPFLWRPATEVVLSLIQMYEANYPEILKNCYIINAPRVFAIAFSLVKKFLNEYTIGKIQIFKSDPKKWKKAVTENIEADQLPMHYGGTLVDPDGNPKYTTKIQQGGKIPEKYYTKKLSTDDEITTEKQYTTVTVRKGEKFTLSFPVTEEGCFLRWDFRTEGHDIRFGVTCKDEDGKENPAVRYHRVAAHQVDETGVLACQSPATYTVTFDNSYSLLRNKKLHYSIYLTQPLHDMDLSMLPTAPPKEINENDDETITGKDICCQSQITEVSVL